MKCIKDEDWRSCRRLLVMWPFMSAFSWNRGRNNGDMVITGISAPMVKERELPVYPCCKQRLGCFLLKSYSKFLPSTWDPLQWSSAFRSCKKGLFFIFPPEIWVPLPKSAMDHFKYGLWAQESLGRICILHYLALHHTGTKILHLIAWNDSVFQSL